jgi:predicted CDP-diglyceride synthetase/phosphatidate cytidylyltransferase
MSSSISTQTVCIPNISPQERRKRLIGGVAAFVITLILLEILMAIDASRWWRIGLLPLFMGAASGFFQWRDKT